MFSTAGPFDTFDYRRYIQKMHNAYQTIAESQGLNWVLFVLFVIFASKGESV